MLYAGCAKIDITPEPGTHLAGSAMGDRRSSNVVHDPLYAKALVLSSGAGAAGGAKKVCILALDVIVITEEYTARIRAAAERLGFDPEAVMVHTTQTHSAPAVGHLMLDPDFPLELPAEREYVRGGNEAYYEKATRGAIAALTAAAQAAPVPVQVGYGRTQVPQHAYNRREEKVIDPELSVVGLRGPDGYFFTLMLHYTCHPVTIFCKGMRGDKAAYETVSAEWPGLWSERVGLSLHPAHRPLVINGCCGNINPGPWETIPQWDLERQVGDLTEAALPLAEVMKFGEEDTLDYRTRRAALDYREVPAERLAEVERVLGGGPGPKLKPGSTPGPGSTSGSSEVDPEWFLAALTASIAYTRKRQPKFMYEINTIRVGDVAIVGLGGEPFAETQMELKRRSPARGTVVGHMCTQYVGYVPPREAYPRFGHEANNKYTWWAKLAPGSAERIVDEAVGMMGEIF